MLVKDDIELSITDNNIKRTVITYRLWTKERREATLKAIENLQEHYEEYKKTGKLFKYVADGCIARSINRLFKGIMEQDKMYGRFDTDIYKTEVLC